MANDLYGEVALKEARDQGVTYDPEEAGSKKETRRKERERLQKRIKQVFGIDFDMS
jgi:hypothetical protein